MAVGLHLKNTIAIRKKELFEGQMGNYANDSKQTNLR